MSTLPCDHWRPLHDEERCPYCNASQSEPCRLEKYDDDGQLVLPPDTAQ
jgi:hypothetical protein